MKLKLLKTAFLFLIIFFGITLFPSCTERSLTRTITVSIPPHPWEEVSGNSLWYMLKWTNGENTEQIFVSASIRKAQINIPLSETVYILAFPLGEGTPFGTAITPVENKKFYCLTQDSGILAGILMNVDSYARAKINFQKVHEVCNEACSDYNGDFRRIDNATLTKNAINGTLNKSAIKINTLYDTGEINALNGIWISESVHDELIEVNKGSFPSLTLPVGIHRFYCPELSRELKITVDYDGKVTSLLKISMVPNSDI